VPDSFIGNTVGVIDAQPPKAFHELTLSEAALFINKQVKKLDEEYALNDLILMEQGLEHDFLHYKGIHEGEAHHTNNQSKYPLFHEWGNGIHTVRYIPHMIPDKILIIKGKWILYSLFYVEFSFSRPL
jgi:hypothetical protein